MLKNAFDEFTTAITTVDGFRFNRDSSSHAKVRNDCSKTLKKFANKDHTIVESLYAIARFIGCYTHPCIPLTFRLQETDELKMCGVSPIARLDAKKYCSSKDFAGVYDFDSTVRDSINPPNAHVIRKRAQFKFGLVYLFQIWSSGVQVYLLQRASLI